jgi:hypothetical protein
MDKIETVSGFGGEVLNRDPVLGDVIRKTIDLSGDRVAVVEEWYYPPEPEIPPTAPITILDPAR